MFVKEREKCFQDLLKIVIAGIQDIYVHIMIDSD